jgi:tetratricopeptide (TPR) repeat protein
VAIALLLAAAVAVAFSPVLGNGFVNLDDSAYVLKNPHVVPGLTPEGAAWALTALESGNWHPLTWLSHMLDVSLFGLWPGGHHLTSLLLHLANTLLLFLLLERMTGAIAPAAAVAALFGIHPLHVESVAWVAERKDVLSTFFGIAAAGAYLGYVRRPGAGGYLAVTMFFALGLASKPMLVTLPLIFLLLDWWPLGRRQAATRLFVEKVPLLLLSAVSGAAAILAQTKESAVAPLGLYPVLLRLENAAVAAARYLGQAALPRNLSVIVPHPDAYPLWKPLLAAGLLFGLTVLAVRQRKIRPQLLLGWAWYVITLTPVIGLVQVGSQASADRYTYVPLIGIFIAVAWSLAPPLGRLATRWPVVVLVAALTATLVLLTHRRTLVWRDSATLFADAVAVDPKNLWAHYYLAGHLASNGRQQEAIEHYRRALALRPTFIQSRVNLGVTLMTMGRAEDAEREFREALRQQPRHPMALQNLSLALAHQRRMREALSVSLELLAVKPAEADDYNNLAIFYLNLGDLASARSAWEELRRLDPARAERLAHEFRDSSSSLP